jgi:sugar phosphate isomerase/epimerase
MNRRQFVQSASMAAAGVFALSACGGGKSKEVAKEVLSSRALGLQLYSLRDVMHTDPKGVLNKLAAFGYKELEHYSYNDGQIFGLPFAEFVQYAKSLGMDVVSGHYGLNQIKGDTWKRAIDDANANAQPYMIVPYINEDQRQTIDDYKRIIDDLNQAGEIATNAGIRFGYHNHNFEFMSIEDQIPYHLMLETLDPKYVCMELDLYWVVYAGLDPITYFQKYPKRFEAWHIKDMDKLDRARNADVGTGVIDFKAILAQAELSGCKHFFVEQETYPGASIDSIEASATYMKTIL